MYPVEEHERAIAEDAGTRGIAEGMVAAAFATLAFAMVMTALVVGGIVLVIIFALVPA